MTTCPPDNLSPDDHHHWQVQLVLIGECGWYLITTTDNLVTSVSTVFDDHNRWQLVLNIDSHPLGQTEGPEGRDVPQSSSAVATTTIWTTTIHRHGVQLLQLEGWHYSWSLSMEEPAQYTEEIVKIWGFLCCWSGISYVSYSDPALIRPLTRPKNLYFIQLFLHTEHV